MSLALTDLGWTVENFRPLTLVHADGSVASGQAAHIVLAAYGPQTRVLHAQNEQLQREVQFVQLKLAVRRLISLRDVCLASDEYELWKYVYDLVFSAQGSQYVGHLLEQLNSPLDYYDPDADYKDDVLAYVNALESHLRDMESRRQPQSAFA